MSYARDFHLVMTHKSSDMTLWDLEVGEPALMIRTHRGGGAIRTVISVGDTADQQRIVSGDRLGTVKIWNSISFRCEWAHTIHNHSVRQIVSLSPGFMPPLRPSVSTPEVATPTTTTTTATTLVAVMDDTKLTRGLRLAVAFGGHPVVVYLVDEPDRSAVALAANSADSSCLAIAGGMLLCATVKGIMCFSVMSLKFVHMLVGSNVNLTNAMIALP